MTNIAAVVALEKSDGIVPNIDSMLQVMRRRPSSWLQKRITPQFGVASISLDEKQTIAQKKIGSGDLLLAVVGEFFGEERLKRKGEPEPSPCNLADLLLELYLEGGVNALCGLNGQYLVIIWEELQKKLTVINDRLGLQRLYYWQHAGRLMLASEIKALSLHPEFPREINQVAVFDLCAAGHPYDDRTLFEDIRALPHGSLMTYQDGKISIQSYWSYRFWDPLEKEHTESEYIDELVFQTREAVRKRVKNHTLILITGGLDSRMMAAMYRQCAGASETLTATIGLEGCKDVQYGREIAVSLGFPHTRIPVDSTYLAEYAPICTWVTEGHMNVYGSWIYTAQDFIQENAVRHVMTGLIGDALSGRHWSPPMMQEKDEARGIELILKSRQADYPMLASVFRPEVFAHASEASLHSVRRSLERAPTHNPLNKFDYLYLQQRISRLALTHDLFKDDCIATDPYTDTNLIDAWLRLPTDLRMHGTLYKKMIVSHIPEVRRLGYERSCQPLDQTIAKENNELLRIINRGQRTIRRRFGLTTERPTGDKPTGCIHYNDWLRSGSRSFALNLLTDRELLGDVFDMPGINRLVTEHMEGKRNEFKLIGAILTFAIWRRQFCQGVFNYSGKGNHYALPH